MADAKSAVESLASRDATIVRTSVIGIVANAFLAAFKAVVGIVTNSIAITLDAVNNLSDALSSVITIVGTKLAGKPADRSHPFGHGRAEYLTAIVIAVIVLWAGITSLRESVVSIIHPEAVEYTPVALLIIAVAVVVKIVLGRYVKGVGERVSSDSLVASGTDAMMDAAISASTLVAAGIYLIWGVSLEAWLGAIISLVIIKAGVDILRETLSEILGARVDADLSRKIKEVATSIDGVRGAYDLFLNDYGPDRLMGSIHVEVPDAFTASDIDKLSRELQTRVFCETGVIISAVGVYSTNDASPEFARIRKAVMEVAERHEEVLETHGLYVEQDERMLRFDAVIAFGVDRRQTVARLTEEVTALVPGYMVLITADSDISD